MRVARRSGLRPRQPRDCRRRIVGAVAGLRQVARLIPADRLQMRAGSVDPEAVAVGPRIFAGFVRSTLDTVDRVDAGLGARVRARLQPDTRRALELASAVSYVPVEIDVEVTERLFDEAGATRACEVLRENLSISLEAPLLSALVSGGLRLFGRAHACWAGLPSCGRRSTATPAHWSGSRKGPKRDASSCAIGPPASPRVAWKG